MEPRDFLSMTVMAFGAVVEEPAPKPRRMGAPESGPWYREVKGLKAFEPMIRKFVDDGNRIYVKEYSSYAKLIPPLRPTETTLDVTLAFSLFGSEEQRPTLHLPYSDTDPREKALCTNQWVKYGAGEFRTDVSKLVPLFTREGDDIVLNLDAQFRVKVWQDAGPIRRFFGRLIQGITETRMRRIVMTPEYWDVQVDGRVRNNVIPRLVPK